MIYLESVYLEVCLARDFKIKACAALRNKEFTFRK